MSEEILLSSQSIQQHKRNADVEFLESSFFMRPLSCPLPTPSEVRAVTLATQQSQKYANPPSVIFQSLGLLVKYGVRVQIAEAKCLRFIRPHTLGRVRVPEVYGWRLDNGQTFIYMELIEGITLEKLWPSIDEQERTLICSQLRDMISQWRKLREDELFLGSIERGPLLDRIFEGAQRLQDLFKQFPIFTTGTRLQSDQTSLIGKGRNQIHIDMLCQMMAKLFLLMATFTLVISFSLKLSDNLTMSLRSSDWEQSRWYPWYWEYCKARWTSETGADWEKKYLPQFLDTDGAGSRLDCKDSRGLCLFDYWDYFVLARGT